jgi:light-regulated signal transduction histidine kinase (bacteriophytochrome)
LEVGLFADPKDRESIRKAMEEKGRVHNIELNMMAKDRRVLVCLFSAEPIFVSNERCLLTTALDITERKQAESQREAALDEIQRLNTELENKVAKRTRDLRDSQLALLSIVEDLNVSNKKVALANRSLDTTNTELESFSYSVSHDLRAPLRSIDGFSLALLEDYQEKLDESGRNYINRIRAATQHMGLLIEDMLKLSRITHAEFHHESIDLSKIAQSLLDTLQKDNPDRDIKIVIRKDMVVNGDFNSMDIALTNLLGNAWKFTGKQKNPLIEFGMTLKEGGKVFFVRDNGVGFDMAYMDKLFCAFQRLHSTDEFPGTGIGLATVKRIIARHGGQIWAEGEVGKGAVFFFTIPE